MTRTRQTIEVRERRRRRSQADRAGSSPERGLGRALVARDTRALSGPAVLQLQREAGNTSVASLVADERPTVQLGLFDMLGSLLGGGAAPVQQQAAGLAGQGVQAGVGALGSSMGGPFGQILAGSAPGLAGAASNLIGGNTAGALSGLQTVGASAAGPLGQTAMGMLGNAIGGQAGGLVGGLGGAVGQGLSSIISGGGVGQAGMGILNAAAPALQQMAGKFLGGI